MKTDTKLKIENQPAFVAKPLRTGRNPKSEILVRGFTPLEKVLRFNTGYKSTVEGGGIQKHAPFVRRQSSLTGFTLLEIVTVIVIITILVGLFMPALNQIKKLARDTKQKAQLVSIEMGVTLYRNDFGEYPPSHGYNPALIDPNDYDYCGAQTLAEAMFGYDLLGVHPQTVYRNDHLNADGSDDLYPDPFNPDTVQADRINLESRKGPYLDRANIGVFEANDVYTGLTSGAGKPKRDRYLICDVFATAGRKVTFPNGTVRTCKIGTPVLYYRANLSPENMTLIPSATLGELAKNIYNFVDNYPIMALGRVTDGMEHTISPAGDNGAAFYDFISDPMIPAPTLPLGNCGRPVRPDSFILISAGSDGLYGTKDDICNFELNID